MQNILGTRYENFFLPGTMCPINKILQFLTWFHVEQPDVVEDVVGPAEASHDEDVVVVEEELGLSVTRRGPGLGDVPLVPHGGYVGQKELDCN